VRILDGDFRSWAVPERRTAVTIGVYDGIHLGHRSVLTRLGEIAQAEDLAATVLTFDRHPLEVISPDRAPATLTPRSQKLELLEAAGVDVAAVLDFDAVRDMPPAVFVDQIIAGALDAAVVAVGRDFRFGRDRTGGIADLRAAANRLGFRVMAVPLLGEGTPVSSTGIRRALETGDVAAAAAGLGRPYELIGMVVRGDGRGRTLGIPTANLEPAAGAAIPARGVYAVEVTVGDDAVSGVANIGTRPTFAGAGPALEIHLLDWTGDLYGRDLAVRFIARLRDEQRFDGGDELRQQIADDVAAARRMLAG
jgi:riboflavin kinase/FMN adenylyltransferase